MMSIWEGGCLDEMMYIKQPMWNLTHSGCLISFVILFQTLNMIINTFFKILAKDHLKGKYFERPF